MLPFIYPGVDAKKILENVQESDIPSLHKAMFNWIKGFTVDSANLTAADIQALRDVGVPDRDIVDWANIACTQTWFVMSADGGGIPLEGNAVVGSVIGLERDAYHCGNVETVPVTCNSIRPAVDDCCWVATNENNLDGISEWANKRFGVMPNLMKSVSLTPQHLPRHTLALDILSSPQTEGLSPRLHALVRRWVNRRNQGQYFDSPTRSLLLQHQEGDLSGFDVENYDDVTKTVLTFADKVVRHAFKITARDAESFQAVGLDDETYVDVLNTVSIQTSMDRLTNALGVTPD